MTRMRATLLLSLLVLGTACTGNDRGADATPVTEATVTSTPSSSTTTGAPDATAAPDTTTPDTTAADTTATGTDAPTTAPVTGSLPEGHSDGSLVTADGRTRTYHLYVPADLDPAGAPLLVALHGGTGSGSQFERSSGFDDLAEVYGMVVVYPDGIGSGPAETDNRTWNARLCCGGAARKGVDDVAFIGRLIDTIESSVAVDPTQVFAAGHSNGGFMAYRLACELSDRIVAVGVQAGGLGIDRCAPSQPVSLLHIHGTADTNVPIDGGLGTGISAVAFPSLDSSLTAVTAAMGCSDATDRSVDGRVDTVTWPDCADGVEVERQLVDGEPHRWIRADDVDSAEVITQFLMEHARP